MSKLERFRERRAHDHGRVTEDAPRVHHLLSCSAVGIDHPGAAVGHNGTEGVVDLHLSIFDHEVDHLILAAHGRCPTLQHAGECSADTTRRCTIGRVLDPHFTKAVSRTFALIEVTYAAGHRHEEAIHAVVGGLADGVDVKSAGDDTTVVAVTGVVDEGQAFVDQLHHVACVGVARLVSGLSARGAAPTLVAIVQLPNLLETVVQQLVLDGVLVLPIGFVVVADAGAFVGTDAHSDVEPLFSEEGRLLVLKGAVHQGLHFGHSVHEQAAHKELRIVVVAFHESVAGVAVPHSTTVGDECGSHLVLVTCEDHVGQALIEILIGEEILDGVIVVAEISGVHHLGLEALFALPSDEGCEDVVVHGVRHHDDLSVLLDVIIPGVEGAGVEVAAGCIAHRLGGHAHLCHGRVDRCRFRFHHPHRDALVSAKHAGNRVVLEGVCPDGLAAQSALHEGRAQHRCLCWEEPILTVNGSLGEGHRRRVHIAVKVALAWGDTHAGDVGEFDRYDFQCCALVCTDEHRGVGLGEVRRTRPQKGRVAQHPWNDGKAFGRFDLLEHGVRKVKTDDDAIVVIGDQSGLLGQNSGRVKQQGKRQGAAGKKGRGHGLGLQVTP